MVFAGILESQGVILAVFAAIVLLIVIIAGVKNRKMGCAFFVLLLIIGLIAYLRMSGTILK